MVSQKVERKRKVKEKKKMVQAGERINIEATCLHRNENGYVFALMEIPYEPTFNITLSATDNANNQRIHDSLEKLRIKE